MSVRIRAAGCFFNRQSEQTAIAIALRISSDRQFPPISIIFPTPLNSPRTSDEIHASKGEQIASEFWEKRDDKDVESKQRTMTQLQLFHTAISEIFASATDTGILTLRDRYSLLAASLDERLAEDERRAINRLLRAVRRGKIQVAA
ncbi:MAG: hypothetical protein AAGA60_21695 [Cyanobacteria bacterium P01_E01_bin.42]